MEKRNMYIAVAVAAIIVVAGLAVAYSSGIGDQKAKVSQIGSDTMLELMQMTAEDFNDESDSVSVSITGGGSGVGITKLIGKQTDVAQASRAIKSGEIADAEAAGVNPVEFKVAIDGIAMIVHKNNPITTLTIEQLKNIYSGTWTNWNQVPGWTGGSLNIELYGRQPTSGTYLYFEEEVLGKGIAYASSMRQQTGNQQILSAVEQDEGAIGYVGVGYAKQGGDNINVLSLKKNDTSPAYSPLDEEHVLDQSYALSRYLFLYTNGTPAGAVKEWMSYVLSSEGGQNIAAEAGFYALPSDVQAEEIAKLG